MSLALLAPLGLVALTALALPLLIHLVRRLELTTTEFAALHWIAERVRPRRRLRFERPWLLLLRLALLALLALLLARPVWMPPAALARAWIVVAPGVDRSAARTALSGIDADWHWLAPGFPRMDDALSPTDVPLASLLRELDVELPADTLLTVVVPPELAGLDGERTRLTHVLDWRVVAGRMRDPDAPLTSAAARLVVRYVPEAEASLAYLRAAVAAWNVREPRRYELDMQPASVLIPDDAAWLVWLAPSTPALTQWIEHGGVALLVNASDSAGAPLWRDAHDVVLAREETTGRGRTLALTGAFAPRDLPNLLDADFPDRLLTALKGPPPAPTRAPATAARPQHDASIPASALRSLATARPLDIWLALLIAGVFLLERLIATRSRVQSPT
ncbi:MAG: BatA domain-containing protein [Dokdonella sp.]